MDNSLDTRDTEPAKKKKKKRGRESIKVMPTQRESTGSSYVKSRFRFKVDDPKSRARCGNAEPTQSSTILPGKIKAWTRSQHRYMRPTTSRDAKWVKEKGRKRSTLNVLKACIAEPFQGYKGRCLGNSTFLVIPSQNTHSRGKKRLSLRAMDS